MTALLLSDKPQIVASCYSAKPDADKSSQASHDKLKFVGH